MSIRFVLPLQLALGITVLHGTAFASKVGDTCNLSAPCGSGLACHPSTHQCISTSTPTGPLSDSVCSAMYNPAIAKQVREDGIAASFGAGFQGSAFAAAQWDLGVVYGDKGEYGCYTTTCVGGTTSVGAGGAIYGTASIYPSWSAVRGEDWAVSASVGKDVKFGLGGAVSATWNFSEDSLYEGMSFALEFTIGAALPIPVSFGGWHCSTKVRQITAPAAPPPPDLGVLDTLGFDPYSSSLRARESLTRRATRGAVSEYAGGTLPNLVFGNLVKVFGGQRGQFYGIDDTGALHRYYRQGAGWNHKRLGGDFRKYDEVFGGTRATSSAEAIIFARNPSSKSGELVVFRVNSGGTTLSGPVSVGTGWNQYAYVTGGWNGVVYGVKDSKLWARRLIPGTTAGSWKWETLPGGAQTMLLDDDAGWRSCKQLMAADYGALYCVNNDDELLYVQSRTTNLWQHGMVVSFSDARMLTNRNLIHVQLLGGYSDNQTWCGSAGQSFPTGDRSLYTFARDRSIFSAMPRIQAELSADPAPKPANSRCPDNWPPPVPPLPTADVDGSYLLKVAGTSRYLRAPTASGSVTTDATAAQATVVTLEQHATYHNLLFWGSTYLRNSLTALAYAGGPESDALWQFRLEPSGSGYRVVALAGSRPGPLVEQSNRTLVGTAGSSGTTFELVPIAKLDLAAGFSDYGGIWAPHRVRVAGDVVHLEGLIKGRPTSGMVIARLPVNLAPDSRVMTNPNRHDTSTRIDIDANGNVIWIAGGTVGWVDLTGISFVRRTGAGLNLASGWVPYGGAYRRPNWTKRSGILRVGGLAKRTTGAWSHVASVLIDDRPKHVLRYALGKHGLLQHVEVRPDGKVVFVSGSSAYGWVNFDGIAYRQEAGQQLVLSTGWRATDDGAGPPSFERTGRQVSLQGGAVSDPKVRPADTAVTSYDRRLVAVLPAGYRPASRLIFNQLGKSGTFDAAKQTVTLGAYKNVRLDIEASGKVWWIGPGEPGTISFDGIVFEVPVK